VGEGKVDRPWGDKGDGSGSGMEGDSGSGTGGSVDVGWWAMSRVVARTMDWRAIVKEIDQNERIKRWGNERWRETPWREI
jgi:hypothetical protein